MSRFENKNISKIIIVVAFILFILLFYFIANNDNGVNFSTENKKANGIAFFYKLLEKHYTIDRLKGRWDDNLESLNNDGLVIAIADSIHMNADAALSFVDYLRKGGKALFISNDIPIELAQLLFHYDDYLEEPLANTRFTNHINIKENKASVDFDSFSYNFFHKDFEQENISVKIPQRLIPYRSGYNVFYKEVFAPSTVYNILPLGGMQAILNNPSTFDNFQGEYKNVYVNFVRFSIGNGYLYYNLLPDLFTNYFVSNKAYLPYFNNIFSHFEDKKIIWASDILKKAERPKFDAKDIEQAPVISSMEFIYKQTNLRNAWYVMLLGGLIFIVFKGKRRQRIVPILPKAENNSKEFIRNIANLYYSTANYGNIATKLVSNFVLDINTKYHLDIKAGDKINDWQLEKIAKISGIDLPALKALFNTYNILLAQRFYNINESKMKNIYKAIQQYYKLENQAKELLIN